MAPGPLWPCRGTTSVILSSPPLLACRLSRSSPLRGATTLSRWSRPSDQRDERIQPCTAPLPGATTLSRWSRPSDQRDERIQPCAAPQAGEVTAPAIEQQLHIMLKQVTERLESFRFNTAISAMMEFLNFALQPEHAQGPVSRQTLRAFLIALAPFAPHLAEELWQRLGETASIFTQRYPTYDAALTRRREVEMAVQINGKVRGTVTVATDSPADVVQAAVLADDKVRRHVADKTVVKTIFVPNRILNLIVR